MSLTFCFSGVADAQLRPDVLVVRGCCGCVRALVVAVVAVTVAVRDDRRPSASEAASRCSAKSTLLTLLPVETRTAVAELVLRVSARREAMARQCGILKPVAGLRFPPAAGSRAVPGLGAAPDHVDGDHVGAQLVLSNPYVGRAACGTKNCSCGVKVFG